MISIIIPYRDRETHLGILIPKLAAMLPGVEILVIEQASPDAFNRGKLLNIGALNTTAEWLVFHDVDMVPIKVDYTPAHGVTQLASSHIQTNDYLGGVTMFDRFTFEKIGGYNNGYFSRAEDNCMMFNLKRFHIPVINRFGIFDILPHARNGIEFDPELWQLAQRPRLVQNQLSICKYEEVERVRHDYYTKITVNL